MIRTTVLAALATIIATAASGEALDAVTEEVVGIAQEEGMAQVSIRDRLAETEYRLTNGSRQLIIVYDKFTGRMEAEEGGEEMTEGEVAARFPGLKGIENAMERHLRNAERRSGRDAAREERRADRDAGSRGGGNGRGNGGGNGNGRGRNGG